MVTSSLRLSVSLANGERVSTQPLSALPVTHPLPPLKRGKVTPAIETDGIGHPHRTQGVL